MSTLFSNNTIHRVHRIRHLSKVLKEPLCITSESSLNQFSSQEFLRHVTVRSLKNTNPRSDLDDALEASWPEDMAVLMLTSGITVNAKTVCLSHSQILVALAGKSSVVQLLNDGSFVNWIALYRVASIVEIHLQALFIGVDPVCIYATDIITNPLGFL